MKYCIFSIDKQASVMQRIAFKAAFEKNEPDGNIIACVGSYKGETEMSYVCLYSDFQRIVRGTCWVAEQESILRISECNKQYASLQYGDFARINGEVDDVFKGIGSLKEVSRCTALEMDGWTYRPDIDQWYIVVQGNPDTVLDEVQRKEKRDALMALIESHSLLCNPPFSAHHKKARDRVLEIFNMENNDA